MSLPVDFVEHFGLILDPHELDVICPRVQEIGELGVDLHLVVPGSQALGLGLHGVQHLEDEFVVFLFVKVLVAVKEVLKREIVLGVGLKWAAASAQEKLNEFDLKLLKFS